jgi:hypothetical protein
LFLLLLFLFLLLFVVFFVLYCRDVTFTTIGSVPISQSVLVINGTSPIFFIRCSFLHFSFNFVSQISSIIYQATSSTMNLDGCTFDDLSCSSNHSIIHHKITSSTSSINVNNTRYKNIINTGSSINNGVAIQCQSTGVFYIDKGNCFFLFICNCSFCVFNIFVFLFGLISRDFYFSIYDYVLYKIILFKKN